MSLACPSRGSYDRVSKYRGKVPLENVSFSITISMCLLFHEKAVTTKGKFIKRFESHTLVLIRASSSTELMFLARIKKISKKFLRKKNNFTYNEMRFFTGYFLLVDL